jgi:hypothetical protein
MNKIVYICKNNTKETQEWVKVIYLKKQLNFFSQN